MIKNKITARKLGKVKGKTVYRFPVRIDLNDTLSRTFESKRLEFDVTSYSARDAGKFARRKIIKGFAKAKDMCPAEITVTGPRGGLTQYFIGWEIGIWEMMQANVPQTHSQMDLIN